MNKEVVVDQQSLVEEEIRKEPNEALIFSWRGAGGRIETHILKGWGPYLFYSLGSCGYSCEDNGMKSPREPGLWRLCGTKVHTRTDWETGLVEDCRLEGHMEQLSLEPAAALYGSTVDELMMVMEEEYPYEHELPLALAMHFPEGGFIDGRHEQQQPLATSTPNLKS